MLGTIVNTATILTGSVAGSLLKKGIREEYQDALYNAMGLAAVGVGINAIVSHMPDSKYPVLFIISLAVGSLIGTALDLDNRFHRLVGKFGNSELGKGLSTGILLFCIGTLSILGPVESAVNGNNTYLFTNATLDLVTSCALATTYGIGIAAAAPVLFCWQGSIYLLASLAENGSDDGSDDGRRIPDRGVRSFDFKSEGLQDAEYAPGAVRAGSMVPAAAFLLKISFRKELCLTALKAGGQSFFFFCGSE